MRRPVTIVLAAALLLAAIAGPVAAGDPVADQAAPSPSAEAVPTPTLAPSAGPSPIVEPTRAPTASEPSAPTDVQPGASAEPATNAASRASVRPLDPTGRWIVLYKNGTDARATSKRQATRLGFATDRTFNHAVRGFSAALSARQVAQLRADRSVAMVVPDEKVELLAQAYPTGINRIGARKSAAAKINGIDERVDSDVAIVDTGIKRVADLNVAGGYNCSTSDRAAWRDVHGHGTHVAGTVGAIDNDLGVVGVAPGVRLWAVKILNDNGEGLLSWYVCGLDWIAAQRDPDDPSRPRFESVNMSVAKWGKDDGACGTKNSDILHAAICRLVASGVTVVAAAGNDHANAASRVPASYGEVITVSALADTDGKPGGLGGNRCYSWGSYDTDDTFANFSNYGGDVDLIAPGKCIWSTVPGGYQYMSGTSMAAPHVTGAAALLKETRPGLTPSEVKEALQYLGTTDWKLWTDPDSVHEKLLNVSKLGARGDFDITTGTSPKSAEAGAIAFVPVTLTRTSTSFERIRFSATDLPNGFSATFSPTSVYGFTGLSTTMRVAVPAGTHPGLYEVTVVGDEHGNTHEASATLEVTLDDPTAHAPRTDAWPLRTLNATTIAARVSWPAATDPSSAIAGYEVQSSEDGAPWSASTAYPSSVRSVATTHVVGRGYQYRVRAIDAVGNWSDWAAGSVTTGSVTQESSAAITYKGTWSKYSYAYASGGTARSATSTTASANLAFSGSGVAFVAPLGSTKGSARVYVDGTYKGAVSLRSSTARNRQTVYSIAFDSVGSHTIEIRPAGNGRIDLDAFVIFR
jgi:subtilisin family serine protease